MKTLYLCDRREQCRESKSCGDPCELTGNPEHAINGGCEDPENHPERFLKVRDYYIEKGGHDAAAFWRWSDEAAVCEPGMA